MRNVLLTLSFILLLSCNALVVNAENDDDLGNCVPIYTAIDEHDEYKYEFYVVNPSDDLRIYFMDEYNPNNYDSNYKVGILFKSNSETQVTVRFRQFAYKNSIVGRKLSDTTYTVNVNSTYTADFGTDKTSAYYKDYVKQFMKDDTYDDFKEFFENHVYYFGYLQIDHDLKSRTRDNYYFYPEGLSSLSVYSLREDGTKYADAISTNMVGYYTTLNYHFLTYYAPFWYIPKNDDKPQFLPDDSGSGGGAGHDIPELPDVDFYLDSKNARKLTGYFGLPTQRWQAEWYLSWKNKSSDIDISVSSFEVYVHTGTISDFKLNYNKFMPFINEYFGKYPSNYVGFYSMDSDGLSGLSLASYIDSIGDTEWRGKKGEIFFLYVRYKYMGVYSDWTIFQCDPDGTIDTVYKRDSSLENPENQIGEDGNRTDGTIVGNNGGSVADGSTPSSITHGNGDAYEPPTVDMNGTLNTLKQLVNTIGELPALASKCLTFLPGDFLSLISVGLSLFVIIAIIKFFK